ncbi:MAG: DUF4249 domain-containing protein [Bacteroidota bacterium]|nr:DUF4249 domain-containing protein [Bacteroidota bacterium]
MKKYISLSVLAISILISSCTKVIDIDLNSKDPQLVIEGNISDQPGPYTVSLTQTVNFSAGNSFPVVSGASVTISDNASNSEVLVETSPGIYQTTILQGVPGRTYYLNVVANGKTYTSESRMPARITLDSLLLEANTSFGSPYYIIPLFADPAGQGNYYRCVETINNERLAGYFLYDDVFSDGLVNGQPLLDFTTILETGDSVSVELQCIDKPTHLYFFSLQQVTSGESGAPANPESNISNHALGYFSAHTSSTKVVVIP